ncbi:hypothetical protein ACJIZ3_005009 [Penstemon smallii]|uniref:Uncharacterized protein n=1 Tax=Penstemon smallii TaxID=265156 RepID=A0ABD3S3P3_9LAMI
MHSWRISSSSECSKTAATVATEGPAMEANMSLPNLRSKSHKINGFIILARFINWIHLFGFISTVAEPDPVGSERAIALCKMEWKSSDKYSRGRSLPPLIDLLFLIKSSSVIFFFTCGLC